MKILYISELGHNETNGGAVTERRNLECLKKYFDVEDVGVHAKGRTTFNKVKDVFFSKVPTLYSRKETKTIKNKILNTDADILFIETTKMGYFTKIARKKGLKVITFVHNCEAKLFGESRGKIYVPFIKKQEELTSRYTDYYIFLNERDKNDFYNIYDVKSKNYFILPITLEDEVDAETLEELKNHKKSKKGIFFGSNFPPNYNGVKWYVENVSKEIDGELVIYGKGFDECKELETNNVKVYGTVDDIKRMMIDADYVISPIFEGSGMKVKTCHALMYGKKIFATDESVEGYDLNENSFVRCNKKEEFIKSINEFLKSNSSTFIDDARSDYENKYSNEMFANELKKIITNF